MENKKENLLVAQFVLLGWIQRHKNLVTNFKYLQMIQHPKADPEPYQSTTVRYKIIILRHSKITTDSCFKQGAYRLPETVSPKKRSPGLMLHKMASPPFCTLQTNCKKTTHTTAEMVMSFSGSKSAKQSSHQMMILKSSASMPCWVRYEHSI